MTKRMPGSSALRPTSWSASIWVTTSRATRFGRCDRRSSLPRRSSRNSSRLALADKPAVPFRVPPGIKLIRVDLKTGMRAGPGTERAILEAFKPGTAPPDSYSVVGDGDARRPWPSAVGRRVVPMPIARCVRAPAAFIEVDACTGRTGSATVKARASVAGYS